MNSLRGDFTYRDWGSRQVQLFLSFVNFQATILLHLLYFSTYSDIKTLDHCGKNRLQQRKQWPTGPKANSLHTVESLRRQTSWCCCCSQPVSLMLATVLEWLTDFLTGAIMESRKAARSEAVASLAFHKKNTESYIDVFNAPCLFRYIVLRITLFLKSFIKINQICVYEISDVFHKHVTYWITATYIIIPAVGGY